ncbi:MULTISPECIES: DUF1146 family protein [unclassified Exiguobacterium]|uniref:DUF1146 family protein n=1 Tax=unclassified Exiguobacterium TaxID=2644629 RepID=UPI0025C57BEB|nr:MULTISPECIES: DUF1146 family protein [unclassified Exiguobacterium]
MTSIGVSAFVSMLVYIVAILLAWWSLLPVKWEKILQHPKGPHAVALRTILAIALGSIVARFLLDYAGFAQRLQFLIG